MRGVVEVNRVLLAVEVRHEVLHLTPVVAEADELPAVLGLPPSSCVAVRLYLAAGRPVAVLMSSRNWPDEQLLRRALHAAGQSAAGLRRARSTEVSLATDQRPGLVCPVGLPADLLLLADVAVGVPRVVYVPTGEGGTVLGIGATDLLAVSGAMVVPLASAALSLARAGVSAVPT